MWVGADNGVSLLAIGMGNKLLSAEVARHFFSNSPPIVVGLGPARRRRRNERHKRRTAAQL